MNEKPPRPSPPWPLAKRPDVGGGPPPIVALVVLAIGAMALFLAAKVLGA